MSFESGMQMGMQALSQGVQMAQRRNERADDQEYRRKRDQLDDGRTAVRDRLDQERMGMARSEFEMKQKLANRDMEDYVTAKTGFDSFQNDYRAIQPDDPQRVAKVTALKLKHLPSIARNKAIASQFEALDGAEKQTAAWVNDNILKDQLSATLTEANRLNLGPEAMAIMKATQAGELSLMDGVSQLSSAMAAARKQQTDEATDREIRVRRAPYEARAENAPARLNEMERAELADTVRERRELRKSIGESEKKLATVPKTSSGFLGMGLGPNAAYQNMQDDLQKMKEREAELGNTIQGFNTRTSVPRPQAGAMSDRDGGGSAEPTPGDVVRGYEFLGGDPGNPKSWRLKP